MIEPTRDLLFCAAALLDRGRTVDRLSRTLTAAALIGMFVYAAVMGRQPSVTLGSAMLVALAGVSEAYFAIRVEFDAALFHRLALAPEASDFAATDTALARLGLLPAAKRGRPAEDRVAGATRLFRFQILALGVQVLSVLAGVCIALRWH